MRIKDKLKNIVHKFVAEVKVDTKAVERAKKVIAAAKAATKS